MCRAVLCNMRLPVGWQHRSALAKSDHPWFYKCSSRIQKIQKRGVMSEQQTEAEQRALQTIQCSVRCGIAKRELRQLREWWQEDQKWRNALKRRRYIHIYIYMYIHMFTHAHTHTHKHTHAHTHMHAARTHTHTHTQTFTHTHKHVHTHIRANPRTHTHT